MPIVTPAIYNRAQREKGVLTDEHVSELVRYWQGAHGLDSDGKAGPATIASIDTALRSERAPSKWSLWDGPLSRRPASRQEIYQMFGNPGTGQPDADWVRTSIVECHPSRGNPLPGVPRDRYVQVHRLIEPYLREALRRCAVSCPEWKMERIAGYVFRHQRHDPRQPLSYHSWGIAVDLDPHLNFAKSYDPGKAPAAWSAEWMQVWPKGLPSGVVEAFRSCGFAWGADWNEDLSTTDHTYLDPMHFEWTERGGNLKV